MLQFASLLLLLLLQQLHGAADAYLASPKMLSEPTYPGKALGPQRAEQALSTKSAAFFGDCSPEAPFEFELFGKEGVAAIGISQQAASGMKVDIDGADFHLGDTPQDFFVQEGAEIPSDILGYPLEYILQDPENNKEGVTARVFCDVATTVVVLAKDKLDLEIHAVVTETADGDELEIVGSPQALGPLKGFTKPKKNANRSPVSFDSETDKKIHIKHEKGNANKGLAMIDGYYTTDEGYKVRRTLMKESKMKKDTFKNPRAVPVKLDITNDGDVEVDFPGMLNNQESLRVDVRIGVTMEGIADPLDVVDVTSILMKGNTVIVHGGWIRNALSSQGLDETTDGWDVVVLDAIVTDPEDEYQVVGVLKEDKSNNGKGKRRLTGLSPNQEVHKRRKLSQRPSPEEVEISEEMKIGKKPTREQRERRLGANRKLSGGHKVILVHGYCAGSNPFPESHFSDYVIFQDYDANRSNNDFALRVAYFGGSLDGCGIIAHSQGGMAALHLYTYYWSCLDYSNSGSRMIQSVGTPYYGTSLAGNIAAIGSIFGAGCGANYDLTYSGASSWLSGIPSWARSQLYYYTTSFTDKWWRYDYCHLASDVLLSDPDDGTTERGNAQLSGGNNLGHKTGQCHTTGMRDPPQCTDGSRNSNMNEYARR